MKNLLVFLLLTSFFACGPGQKHNKDLLIGTWKNQTINVQMNSYQNGESDSLLVVQPDQWEEILKIKPIVTVFNEDGTFSSDYRNPNDSLVFQSKGEWHFEGDSLVMVEYEVPNSYHVTFEGKKAKFSAVLDWDEDGIKDDVYKGMQLKTN